VYRRFVGGRISQPIASKAGAENAFSIFSEFNVEPVEFDASTAPFNPTQDAFLYMRASLTGVRTE
jgi:hypothetical protein